MSEAVVLALISAVAAPLIGAAVYMVKTTYSDNRESWKQRAESAEAREAELKNQLLPAVSDLKDGVKDLAEGQAEDRKNILPAITRVEKIVSQAFRVKRGDEDASSD